jgi:hypothetical protein
VKPIDLSHPPVEEPYTSEGGRCPSWGFALRNRDSLSAPLGRVETATLHFQLLPDVHGRPCQDAFCVSRACSLKKKIGRINLPELLSLSRDPTRGHACPTDLSRKTFFSNLPASVGRDSLPVPPLS